MRICSAILTAALALEAVPAAQSTTTQASRQPQFDTFAAGATAVLVDVVVRNKRGQPLRGLAADDFQVFEDGVRQTIGSFSVVERAGGVGIKVGRRISGSTSATGASRTRSNWRREPRSRICR
jgi:hypothetical protein